MKVVYKTESNRYYLYDENMSKLKMIPMRYKDFAHKLKIEDFDRKRLTLDERLQLELMAFKRRLLISERYVYDLIKTKKFEAVREVSVKFGEDRLEGAFGSLYLRIPKDLFNLAHKALYPHCKIKSMS